MKVITDSNVRQFIELTGSPAKSLKGCRKDQESTCKKNINISVLAIMTLMMSTMLITMVMVVMMISAL